MSQDKYWRSLAELEDAPELESILSKKFSEQASGMLDTPLNRRNFVQLMGASLALAGITSTGCRRWEEEKIVPLSKRPDDYVPGTSKQFATAMELGGYAETLLATCFEGRPTKMEGNGHGTSTFAQASVLDLYDPDRSNSLLKRAGGKETRAEWPEFADIVKNFHQIKHGPGLRFLSEATSSETVAQLKAQILEQYPTAKWYEYEPLSRDNEVLGTKLAFGVSLRPYNRLDQAKIIVSIDGDMFRDHPAANQHAADFAKGRRPDQGVMNRLYAIESAMTGSGAISDHRLPLRAELTLPFLQALEAALGGGTAPNAAFLGETKIKKFLAALAGDLKANKGRSILVAGYRQPAAVHALVAKINASPALLGGLNRTVQYFKAPADNRASYNAQLGTLVAEMNSKQVKTLVVLGGNPVFDAPVDLGFDKALAKVENRFHLSYHDNETSAQCTWQLPRTHYLESWGDVRAWDGTHTIVQPCIDPFMGGKSVIELLAMFLDEKRSAHELVRGMFKNAYERGVDGDAGWRKALHDGTIARTRFTPITAVVQNMPTAPLSKRQSGPTKIGTGELEVVFCASSIAHDGRYANNAWMQELPDFITRLTWDNPAVIGPGTASDLGISDGSLLELTIGKHTVRVAATVVPGQAYGSVLLHLGLGHTHLGYVAGHDGHGKKGPGFDTYKVRTAQDGYIAVGAKVRKVGHHSLANVQEHWNIDGRGAKSRDERVPILIKESDMAGYKKNPNFATPEPEFPLLVQKPGDKDAKATHMSDEPASRSLFKKHVWQTDEWNGNKWAMSTDLGMCTGCHSCVIACQAENNTVVVGKDQVIRNREMAWLRIDRYFKGNPDDPQVALQPLACQQCENAPCEEVCPVGATLHTDEGLNDMVYNRCVGTRYCANNCPYRVRRFNFLDYHKDTVENPRNKIRRLLFNPDVSIRSRGVMEKCTFCVQRLERAKIEARNEGRDIRKEDNIKTACQEACPTGAIVFGNLTNKRSEVSKLHHVGRAYDLLEDYNTLPRNKYLARIRNPNKTLG